MSKSAFSAMIVSLAVSLAACGAREEPAPEPSEQSSGHEAEPGSSSEASPEGIVAGEDACTTDADCVPAACCHAAACVGRANAPSCGDAMCTMECRANTIDCGGGCLCHEGRCAARLATLSEPQVQGEDAPQ